MNEIYCPEWWRSSLDDVEEALKLVKKGSVCEIARSAGNRPIYKIEYGKSNVRHGSANLSSALGAHDIRYFADKTGEDYVPTLLLVGANHGGEFEGVVGLLNLIKLIETGTDYRGEEHPELLSYINKIHLIIVPISNPDGRARVPFNSVIGITFHDFRYYNQGTWKKDGTLCGWPGCKSVHPIKEASEFLGAYFNDDGVNMMHEDFFGYASKESTALLDICRNEVPDLSLLLHGGTNAVTGLLPTDFTYPAIVEECLEISNALKARGDEEGVRIKVYEQNAISLAFGITSAMHHLCGTPVMTFESNQGLSDAPGICCDEEEIYKAHILLFEESAKHLVNKFGK